MATSEISDLILVIKNGWASTTGKCNIGILLGRFLGNSRLANSRGSNSGGFIPNRNLLLLLWEEDLFAED